MKITKYNLQKYNPIERLAKESGITLSQFKQIIIWIETDFLLGHHRFAKVSKRFYEITGIYIDRRRLRYMYNLYNNYINLYDKIKKGNYMYARLRDTLYKKV